MESEIPIKNPLKHKCGAVESIESLSGKLDYLEKHVRNIEKNQNEEFRKIWIRIAIITASVIIGIESSDAISILIGGLL